MSDIQTIVVGAGVVGLAIAAELARCGREVLVLDAESAIGQGVSSRNSEVIHAGIYYPPGSLKAQVCVRGKKLLYAHCEKHHITANGIGKLIVACDNNELAVLETLRQRALKNGVADITFVDADAAKNMQPGLQCCGALHSPSTGIVDSHSLMLSLHAEIENNGGMVVCNSVVSHIETGTDSTHTVTIKDDADTDTILRCNEVINSAGLHAVPLANKTLGLPINSIPQAKYAKGNYFKLQGRTPFSSLIYPAPVQGGLGVHLTIDIGGQARFGPDVEWLDDDALSETSPDYQVDPRRADSFYAAIRTYWPALPDNALLPDYAGIRPKIQRPGTADADFEIATHQQHGIAGLVNLYGIESPGLTSSLAIAEIVASVITNPQG